MYQFLFIITASIATATINQSKLNYEFKNDLNPIENYGRWCGPGHGGYNDCCNGTWCPSCGPGPAVGNWSFTLNLDCLRECPPIDNVDLSCAQHDTCVSVFGAQCGLFLTDQHCFCNSLLARTACHYDFFNKVCLVFSPYNYGLGCWACGQQESQDQKQHLKQSNVSRANTKIKIAPKCLDETQVLNYGPDTSVALAMLSKFNSTGITDFLSVSSQFAENCTT